MVRPRARRTIENALKRIGFTRIAGVDEVGRGCLAGPVTAAAVILPDGCRIRGIADSKQLTARARERLHDEIVECALAWAVASCAPAEIDQLNIHRASLRAMQHAVMALVPLPGFVLVDAFRVPGLPMAQRGIVHGDRACTAIAAASIVAKVVRDREMVQRHAEDPRYGFDRHKGYATAAHLAAVAQFGYSVIHRRSFRPSSLFDTIDSQGVRLDPDPPAD